MPVILMAEKEQINFPKTEAWRRASTVGVNEGGCFHVTQKRLLSHMQDDNL